jgi:ABC-type transport system involved in multi-copper enzyme maturation permease subunit
MRGWQNPILFRELRCEGLGGGWVWMRRILPTAIAGGVGCGALFALWLNHPGLWLLGVAAIAGITVPALAAPAITREFEHGTFDSLVVSPLRPFSIIWPKIYLAVRTGMVLASVMIVLGAPLAYFGNPAALSAIPVGLGVIAASMIALASIGVFCSMASRSTSQAMVAAYAVPLFLFAGGPALCHLLRIYSDHPVSSYSWLAAASPATPLLTWGHWPWLIERSPWLREIAQFYGSTELAANYCAISAILALALFLIMVFGFEYFWKRGPMRRY